MFFFFSASEVLPFENVGCYKDNYPNVLVRPLPDLILNMRNSIKWTKEWRNKFIKLCAKKALKKNFWYFAVQFYGECHSGRNASATYDRDGKYKPDNNTKTGCEDGIGKESTNFVYRFKGGNFSSCFTKTV